MATCIKQPELFRLTDTAGECFPCATQEWYHGYFQRMGGCGPTAASHQIWYLAQTRKEYKALWPSPEHTCEGFVELMNELWKYITPGLRGVNTTQRFTTGFSLFGKDHGLCFDFRVLEVPQEQQARSKEKVAAFLDAAFEADLPVAFLNLDNGEEEKLDKWHWVILIGRDGDTATMLDDGKRTEINWARWLHTTRMNGGFVVAAPCEE